MGTVKVNLSGIEELDFPTGVSSASITSPGVATVNLTAGAQGPVGPAGPPGASMSFLDYLFSTNTAAPPSSGYVELNNATQTAATLIWVHHITNANNDATIFLDAVVTGDEVYIQEKANSAQLLKFNVTANAVDRGTYTELAVSLISRGGQAIGNKDSIFFGIVVRGQPGPPGPTAVSTDAGNVAKLGTDSLIFVPPYTAGSGVSITNQVITNTSPNVQSDWNASSGLAVILNKPALATGATTGSYTDLINKPTIPAAQVNSDWNAVSGVAQILNKPAIPTTMALSAITAATANNTIANASYTQTWNWTLTGAFNGHVIGETAAGAGTGALVQVNGLSNNVTPLDVESTAHSQIHVG